MRLFGGKKRKKIRVLATGGWGDMLLCTPTIKALRIKFPDAYIIVYVPEKIRSQLYFHSPHMNKISTTTILNNPVASYIFLYQFHKFIDLKYTRIMPGLFPIIPVIDLIANLANVELEDRRLQFFLSGQEERAALDFLKGHPNPIIVHMSTKGKNKTWIDQNWEEVIRRFPGYTFIQLGEDKDYALQGAVDMRGKTSFREAAALIKHSLSFIGVDSSLSHLTNAFDIRGVILFGATTPVAWGHPNNINIFKGLRCSPCVELLQNNDCPYDKKCMTIITVDEVCAALQSQLNIVLGEEVASQRPAINAKMAVPV